MFQKDDGVKLIAEIGGNHEGDFDYALELEPKFIIIALYPPNDLVDICNSIKNVDYWKKWAIDNGFNPNECGIYKIVENKKYPIFNYINSLFNPKKNCCCINIRFLIS